MKAADFSNWQRVPASVDLRALKVAGITRIIVGPSFPRQSDGFYIGPEQLAACTDFERQVYGWLKLDDSDWRALLRHAQDAAIGANCKPIWIDIEEEPKGSLAGNSEAVRTRIRQAINFTGSRRIYTRKELWDRLTDSWDIVGEYPDAELWNCDPPPNDGLYGGFTHAAMTQTDFDVDIGTGFQVDLSEYEEEAMAYTDAEIDAKVGAVLQALIDAQKRIFLLEAKQKAAAAALGGG